MKAAVIRFRRGYSVTGRQRLQNFLRLTRRARQILNDIPRVKV